MLARMYHVDAAEVLPNRASVSFEGAASSEVRPSEDSSSSMTPRPPVWSRKCSKAFLKSGTYDLSRAALRSSPQGRTLGPREVMLALRARPATATTFLRRKTPLRGFGWWAKERRKEEKSVSFFVCFFHSFILEET